MAAIAIKGFKILQKIGEGSLAEIYKARQISLDRMVVIKVLKAINARDPQTVEQFKSEANAVAHLKHNNIVQVYEAGEQKGTHYYIMEHVGGESVAERLKRKGRLPEDQVLLIGESIAVALEYAWKKYGLIHCDIKPENVLIDQDGTIKLADFSGLTEEGVNAGSKEFAEELLGTPNYMAPEHVRGENDIDFRVDMYALGALLYQAATGFAPFKDRTGKEALEGQLSDFIENPRKINSSLSLGAAQLIERLMAKNRKDRPTNWKDVLSDIHAVEKGRLPAHGIPRDMVSTVRHAGPYADERPAAAAPGAFVVHKQPAQPPAEKTPEEPPAWAALAGIMKPLSQLAGVLVVLGVAAWMLFNYNPEGPLGDKLRALRDALNIAQPAAPERVETADLDETESEATDMAEEEDPYADSGYETEDTAMTDVDTEEPEEAEPEVVRVDPLKVPKNLVAFAQLMAPVFDACRNLDFDAASDTLRKWQMKNIGHPYWEQVSIEKDRITLAQDALRTLDFNTDKVKGASLKNVGPSRLSGQVVNVLNGVVMIGLGAGEGQASVGVELADLPGRDVAALMHRADEKEFERNMAALLISRGKFDSASGFIVKAEEKGQDVYELVTWMEDWQFSVMNSRAEQALQTIEALADSGRAEDARAQLSNAQRIFANSDIFRWVRTDKIRQLERRIERLAQEQESQPAAAKTAEGDVSAALLADIENAASASVSDLANMKSNYEGDVVKLRLTHRGRINPSEDGRYTTLLSSGDDQVEASFDSRGFRWVRNIPVFDTGKNIYHVYVRVKPGKYGLQVVGLEERTEEGAVNRVW